MKKLLRLLFLLLFFIGCNNNEDSSPHNYKKPFVGKWEADGTMMIFEKDSIAYQGRLEKEYNRLESKIEYFFTPKVNLTYYVTKDSIFFNTWDRTRSKVVKRTAVTYEFNELQTSLQFNNSGKWVHFFDKPITIR